jgi:hypothetical protein
MPKASTARPKSATVFKSYHKLQALVASFIKGDFPLVAIVGRPGLSKTESLAVALQKAKQDKKCLILKGRVSPIELFEACYVFKDKPIIMDDADNLLSQPLCREYVKALTETKKYKLMAWRTRTPLNIPENEYHTSSPVCIIANAWNSADPIMQAIESRAEFVYFDPPWSEVYEYVGTWFWDQEIYDYVHKKLDRLKAPDIRLFIKAWNRKKANNPHLHWQEIFDDHLDDEVGQIVRELLADRSFDERPKGSGRGNSGRAEAFTERTTHLTKNGKGMDRKTFYNRMKTVVVGYRPKRKRLSHTTPPVERKPG